MDLSKVCTYTDFFVVCSGTNRRHVAAIAEGVMEEAKKANIRPLGVEGLDAQRWVLADFGDVILHVFDPDMRDFYDLEALWHDAPKRPLPPEEPPAGEPQSAA